MNVSEIKDFRKNAFTDSSKLPTMDCIVVIDDVEHPYTWMQGDPYGLGPAMDALLLPLLETQTLEQIIIDYPSIKLT